MVKITVEILPFGDPSFRRATIAEGEISNIGGGSGVYDYIYRFSELGSLEVSPSQMQGDVKGHQSSDGSLKLLYLALKDHFESRS